LKQAVLELEVVAPSHQLAVCGARRPVVLKLTSMTACFWVWLYRIRPSCLEVMVLVKGRRPFAAYVALRRFARHQHSRDFRGLLLPCLPKTWISSARSATSMKFHASRRLEVNSKPDTQAGTH
jgi:hypothetical protein